MPITIQEDGVRVETSAGSVFEFEADDPKVAADYLSDMNNLASEIVKHYPQERWRVEQTKNTQLGDALRALASRQREGETRAAYDRRLYGEITNESKADESHLTGLARSSLQGGSLGWADEAISSMWAKYLVATDPKAAEMGYENVRSQLLERERSKIRKFAEEHPWQDMGAQILGGAASAAVLQPIAASLGAPSWLAAPVSRGQKFGTGAVLGGASGLTMGEGVAEGDRHGSDRVLDTIIGAGGGLVGVLGGEALSRLFGQFKSGSLPVVGSIAAERAGVTPEVVEFFRRIGGMPQEVFDDAMARLQMRQGQDAVLGEAIPGAADVLDAVANAGTTAGRDVTKEVGQRAAQGARKLTVAMDDALGAPGMSQARDLVMYGQKNPLTDLYDKAYEIPPIYEGDDGFRLSQIIEENLPPQALAKAIRMERMEFGSSAPQSLIAREVEDGEFVLDTMPNTRQLDLISRALLDAARDTVGVMGGMSNEGRLMQNLGREIRTILRRQNVYYDQALRVASNLIGQGKAKEAGYAILNTRITRDDAAEALADLGKLDVGRLKQGVRMFLDDQMARVNEAMTSPGADIQEAAKAFRILSSRAARDKIAMILGQESAGRFLKRVDEAVIPLQLRALLHSNSKTAMRQAIQDIVDDQVKSGVLPAAQEGRLLQAAGQLLTKMFADPTASVRQKNKIARDLTNVLLRKKGADAERTLSILQKRIEAADLAEETAGSAAEFLAPAGAVAGGSQAGSNTQEVIKGASQVPDRAFQYAQ